MMNKHHDAMKKGQQSIRVFTPEGVGPSGPTLAELKGSIGTYEVPQEERDRILRSAYDWSLDQDACRRAFKDRLMDELIVRGQPHPLTRQQPKKLIEMGTIDIPVWSRTT